MSKESFEIPLGEIFDSYILLTYGPPIPVKFVSTGRVNTGIGASRMPGSIKPGIKYIKEITEPR